MWLLTQEFKFYKKFTNKCCKLFKKTILTFSWDIGFEVFILLSGLYFCICVDVSDNNLFYLEAIHNFVEVLNEYFHNVCELDLVFNFYKVYTVVDEMFLAGEMRETSQTKVLKQLTMYNSLEWIFNLETVHKFEPEAHFYFKIILLDFLIEDYR